MEPRLAGGDTCGDMNAAPEPHNRATALLLEHCAALEAEPTRPTASERLERVLGGYLTALLVGALTRGRPRPRPLV